MAVVPDEQWPAKASDVWINFAQAATPAQVCQSWLEVLCLDLLRKCSGLVLLVQPDGSYAPAAAVPPRDLSHLADIATEALRTREGLVRRDALGHVRLAYPLQMLSLIHI